MQIDVDPVRLSAQLVLRHRLTIDLSYTDQAFVAHNQICWRLSVCLRIEHKSLH